VVTVYCHEVAHCMLGHLWRVPPGAEIDHWNIACDHAVNLMLEDWSKEVMSKRLADPFPFPKCGALKDPQYRGMSEEVIFSKIPKPPPGKGGKNGAGNPGNFGQFTNSNNGTQDPVKAKQQANSWDNTLGQAMEIAKQRGLMPAGMERQIQKHFDPGVPWYELLRNWVREQAADDWDWHRPNKYYDAGDFILPSLYSERIGAIVFAIDTSGSIDANMLAHFKSEMQGCLDDMKPEKLVELCCDAAIHAEREYHVGDTVSPDAPGGGGTSFVPVFTHCAKMVPVPKCLVYLTDLCGTMPKTAPEYPTLWVTYGTKETAPFGETIPVEI
jgi:predicted metal-dependent peptidase